jgi:hypothetical protein
MLFDDAHLGIDAAAVRVVADADVAQDTQELEILFPHDIVLSTPLGCGHSCVYTDCASAAVVAQRIAQHLRDVEHRRD